MSVDRALRSEVASILQTSPCYDVIKVHKTPARITKTSARKVNKHKRLSFSIKISHSLISTQMSVSNANE